MAGGIPFPAEASVNHKLQSSSNVRRAFVSLSCLHKSLKSKQSNSVPSDMRGPHNVQNPFSKEKKKKREEKKTVAQSPRDEPARRAKTVYAQSQKV